MRSSKNKDDPFISEFDMGLTDHLVEHLGDLDMITEEDYKIQKERIRVLNRPPSELKLKELKDRLRAYGCWKRGMSREEMEFQLAYQNRRSERLTRLREASDIAGFGFTQDRLNSIVGDTKANKGTRFRRRNFFCPDLFSCVFPRWKLRGVQCNTTSGSRQMLGDCGCRKRLGLW